MSKIILTIGFKMTEETVQREKEGTGNHHRDPRCPSMSKYFSQKPRMCAIFKSQATRINSDVSLSGWQRQWCTERTIILHWSQSQNQVR